MALPWHIDRAENGEQPPSMAALDSEDDFGTLLKSVIDCYRAIVLAIPE